MSNNIVTIQQIYQCFGQGDIPGIMSRLSEDVSFFNGSNPEVAPFGGVFKGKDGVLRFFQALGETTQTTHFEPFDFQENGNQVTNTVRHDGLITSTGKPFSVTVQFAWTLNEAGQASDWKGTGDFTSIDEAFKS